MDHENKCSKCDLCLDNTMTLNNFKFHTFPLIDFGESIHFECYVELIIDKYLKSKQSKDDEI